MPRVSVVFDTNGYRSMSKDVFEAMLSRERIHSVVGNASYWVVIELLAHIADKSDPDYHFALSSIRRLARHCRHYDGQRFILRFLADSEAQVVECLFGMAIPNRADNAEAYGQLVGTIAEATDPDEWAHLQPRLDYLKAHVSAMEKHFADDVFQQVVVPHWPSATTWTDVTKDPQAKAALLAYLAGPEARVGAAAALVVKAANEINLELSGEQASACVRRVLELFPAPISFYLAFLRKVAEGYDLTVSKNVNSLWDMQVAFSTSLEARIGGSALWVITADKAILSAAKDEGLSQIVMRPNDYLALLELDSDGFIERVG